MTFGWLHAVRKRHRIIALAEIGIREIHPHREVADSDLPILGVADRLLFDPKHVRAAGLIEAYDFCQ